MKKPMIAVSPLYDKERESYWMLPGYMQGIEQSGGGYAAADDGCGYDSHTGGAI